VDISTWTFLMANKAFPQAGLNPALPSHRPLVTQTQFRHRSRRCPCKAQHGQHDGGKGESTAGAQGYDPSPAQGFAPSGDDPELWWVVKYEERRKAIAAQEALEGEKDKRKSSSQPSPALIHPGETSPNELEPQKPNMVAAVVQAVQLSLVLAALFLWPASTQPAGLVCLRVWFLYLIYWLFFSQGTVRRQLKFGKTLHRSKDKGRSSWSDRLALIGFITSVVLLHWLPVLRYTKLGIYPTEITGYEALGLPTIAAALFLHQRAVRDLGEASGSVATPTQLVVDGAYARIQHPIYTSHMLLFFGTAMLLHSAPTALLFILVCTTYYLRLTAQEARVLDNVFGDNYRAYAAKTPRFLPFPRL